MLAPTVVVNASVALACPVFGLPPPDVVWYKNGRRIDFAQQQHLYTDQGGQRLVVMAATTDDSAIYVCNVSSEAGRDSLAYQLSVHGE